MALVKDLEEYECPLCMEKLVPPVFQCPSGHLFCKKCIGNYITCPTCKRPTVLQDPAGGHIKNLEIERIIRDYQTHECPWTGCLKRVKLDNLESHKLGCIKRSGNFCSWLKFHKCKEERPLSELLGHLESAHGGSGHYAQSTLETVEFRDECPAQGSRNDRRRKIFTCWIRGRDNVNGVLEHECFPFILMITYGKRSVYWTPFIIASSKGLKDGPFKCELRFYRDCKIRDVRSALYISWSHINYLPDQKWTLEECFNTKYPHIRRFLTGNKVEANDGKVNQDSDSNDDDSDDGDSDENGDSDYDTVAARADVKKALPYIIIVSFRDTKTGSYYRFQAQKNYVVSSEPGASSSSVNKPGVEPSKPGTSTSMISKPCPK